MQQMSWILQFFETHLKVYHSISQYLNLLNHHHGWFPEASLTDSKLTFSRFFSFVRNKGVSFTIPGLWRWISLTYLSFPRLVKIHMELQRSLSDGTCTSMPGTSTIKAIPTFKIGSIFCLASIDANGLELFWFLGAVYSLHIDVRLPHPSSSRRVVTK